MTSYFKDLYKNNNKLSDADREKLVFLTRGLLIFDALFSNKDVSPAQVVDLLIKYDWFWLRLKDGTDIMVTAIKPQQDATDAWVDYYSIQKGTVEKILFSELLKKIDPALAAKSVIRLSIPAVRGGIYNENRTPLIDHEVRFNLMEGIKYADQYREVEKQLMDLQDKLASAPLEVLEKIRPLLLDCYSEVDFYEGAREDIQWAKDFFTPGQHYFLYNAEAKTIVDRYSLYLTFHFYPNVRWFHVYVFEDFAELALSIFHRACQAALQVIFADIRSEVTLQCEKWIREFDAKLKTLKDTLVFPGDLMIEVSRRMEKLGRYYYVSVYPSGGSVKNIDLPIEVLGQGFLDKKALPAPKNKRMAQGQTLKVRSEQLDFILYTRWIDEQLEATQKLNFSGIDLYRFTDVKTRLLVPIVTLLKNSLKGDKILLNKISQHPIYSPRTDNGLVAASDEYILRWIQDYYQKYLNAFTIFVPAEVNDPGRLPDQYNYLKASLPLTLDGRLTMDCLMYAMVNAFMMNDLLKKNFELSSYYVIVPFHIGMIAVYDINKPNDPKGKEMVSFQNNNVFRYSINQELIQRVNKTKSCPSPSVSAIKGHEFFGQLAVLHFEGLVALDLPFKVLAVAAGEPAEDILWKQARKEIPYINLFRPNFIESKKGRELMADYLGYYTAVKDFHNDELIRFWNVKAENIWTEYMKDKKADEYKRKLREAFLAYWSGFEFNVLNKYDDRIGTMQLKNNGVEIFDDETSIFYTVPRALRCGMERGQRRDFDLLPLLAGDGSEFLEMYNHLKNFDPASLEPIPFYVSRKLYPE